MATYSTTLSVLQDGATYNIELNRWSATIELSTTSIDFYNHTIEVTKGGSSVGTIAFDSAGNASYTVHETGTYVFTVRYTEDEVYNATVSVTEETTYTAILNRWTSTIRVYTAASAFYGEELIVTKGGSNLGTITIDNSGYAYYLAHEAGSYDFTLNHSTHESYTVTGTATTDGQTVDVTLTRWTATINLSTTSSEFYGHSLSVTRNGDAYDTPSFTAGGALAYEVHETGTYEFTLTYSASEIYTQTFNITTNGQSLSATMNRFTATINLSTTSTDFYNHSIDVLRADNASGTYTAFDTTSFNSSGSRTYSVHKTGSYKFIVTYGSETYEQTANITTDGQTANITLNRWTATINVSTSSSELVGQTLTVYKNGTSIDTLVLPSTTGTTKAYTVHATGTYKFAIVYEGTEYSDEVNVTAQTTYSVAVNLGPELVSWSAGTDAQIQAMIDAYYNGTTTLAEIQSVWSVGDSRTITLSAMTATGVGESHRSQSVEMVILDFEHDTLATPINGKTKALITVQQKNCLRDATVADDGGSSNTEHGYMNSSNTNNGGWTSSARRTWCNNVYYAALPSGFKAMVKEATHQTTAGNQSATMNTDTDKCFLPSEWEVFGATTYAKAQEGTQYEYYKTASNRYKLPKWNSSIVSDYWWERSPYGSSATAFCRVGTNGGAGYASASAARGLAPACCL